MIEKLANIFHDSEQETDRDEGTTDEKNFQEGVDESFSEKQVDDDADAQHLAAELLGDEEDEEDIDEKIPGSSRSERENDPKARSPYFNTSQAAPEKESDSLDIPDSARKTISVQEIDNNFVEEHGSGRDLQKIETRESSRRDGVVEDSRRGEFQNDRPWRGGPESQIRSDVFEGPPRRDEGSDSNRRDASEAQRRESTEQNRRIVGDGFSEQVRRAEAFDSRRGNGFEPRRQDAFDPRRVDSFEGRRGDGFDSMKRTENFEPFRRGDSFEAIKRVENLEGRRENPSRWGQDAKHDYRVSSNQYSGDRSLAVVESSRYAPKIEVRHDYPRGGSHLDSPRGPAGDLGVPSGPAWTKVGATHKEWPGERDGDGPSGARYPMSTRPTLDDNRGIGVAGPRSSVDGRWNQEGISSDARRGLHPVRVQSSQNQSVNDMINVRENVRSRGDVSGEFHGHVSRGREVEGAWGRVFSDQDVDRGRERINQGAVVEPQGGFSGGPGRNSVPNFRNGGFQVARPNSPPRQTLPSHEDRRPDVAPKIAFSTHQDRRSDAPPKQGMTADDDRRQDVLQRQVNDERRLEVPPRQVLSAHDDRRLDAPPRQALSALDDRRLDAPPRQTLSAHEVRRPVEAPPRQPLSGHDDRRPVEAPPRQALSAHDDRRPIETRVSNFSAPLSPKTQPGHLHPSSGPSVSGPNMEKSRMDANNKSRWGRPVVPAVVTPSQQSQIPISEQPHHQIPNQPYHQQLQSQYQQHQQHQLQQPQPQNPVQAQSQLLQVQPSKELAKSEPAGIRQAGDKAEIRGNLAVKKRKLYDDSSIAVAAPAPLTIHPQEAQPSQRHVVSLKGINNNTPPTRSEVVHDTKIQQEVVYGSVPKRVRTVRSEDVQSTTTVTITGINVEDQRGSWQHNKGRGGFQGGGMRGRGRG